MTLKGLVMIRKNICDADGKEILGLLKSNEVLERIELEGNDFGPESMKACGDVIRHNKFLRVIDLEGNNLTNGEKSYAKEEYESSRNNDGVKALCLALEDNVSLLSINLSDCNLDNECSEYILKMLRSNDTIINVDLHRNPKISKIDNIREI